MGPAEETSGSCYAAKRSGNEQTRSPQQERERRRRLTPTPKRERPQQSPQSRGRDRSRSRDRGPRPHQGGEPSHGHRSVASTRNASRRQALIQNYSDEDEDNIAPPNQVAQFKEQITLYQDVDINMQLEDICPSTEGAHSKSPLHTMSTWPPPTKPPNR